MESTKVKKVKYLCKNCTFYNKFCYMKDLYTEVNPNHECDEVDITGMYYFTNKK